MNKLQLLGAYIPFGLKLRNIKTGHEVTAHKLAKNLNSEWCLVVDFDGYLNEDSLNQWQPLFAPFPALLEKDSEGQVRAEVVARLACDFDEDSNFYPEYDKEIGAVGISCPGLFLWINSNFDIWFNPSCMIQNQAAIFAYLIQQGFDVFGIGVKETLTENP